MDFSEADFAFSDDTFAEVSRQVKWSGGADLDSLYASRQGTREDVGAGLFPRLFQSILSADRRRTALFFADLKTEEKGWIQVQFDALDPEEILVQRLANWGPGTYPDTWLHFPAGRQDPRTAFQDPLARHTFIIRSYKIDATVTAGTELSATARLVIEPRVSGERAFPFILDPRLPVQSVKNEQGAPLPFFRPRNPKDRNQSYGDFAVVALPEPSAAGKQFILEFRYGGKRAIRQVGSGNYFCESFGWYPTLEDSFASRADFDLTFHSPKKYIFVATGEKTSDRIDGDWQVTTWKSEIPLAVAGFAFGDFKTFTDKANNVEINVYANREADDYMRQIQIWNEGDYPSRRGMAPNLALGSLSPAAMVKTMAEEVANNIRVFETYFGPYPYKHLSVTNIPYSYGQGWPTLLYISALSFLDSTQRQQLGIRHHTEITDFFRAHESSHQWWGHRVGWKSYHDQWLSEGFAQFSGNLYVLYRQNEKEYLNLLRQDRIDLSGVDLRNRHYETLGPIWMGRRLSSSDSPRGYSYVIYRKGGLVLNMLRMMFFDPQAKEPDARFIAMMKDFTSTYDNKPASTEDFKAIVEKHMLPVMDIEGNRRMDWFFRQYVYGTGIPQYHLGYRLEDMGNGKWKVIATVERLGGPDNWKDIVLLYAQLPGRVIRVGWAAVPADRVNKFEIVFPVKPEKLMLNYREDILADIK